MPARASKKRAQAVAPGVKMGNSLFFYRYTNNAMNAGHPLRANAETTAFTRSLGVTDNPSAATTTTTASSADTGGKEEEEVHLGNGNSISNKATILQDVDALCGRDRPPAMEYILVKPFSMFRVRLRSTVARLGPYLVARYRSQTLGWATTTMVTQQCATDAPTASKS